MATFVSFLDLKTGATIDVNANDDSISSLEAIPSSVLTPAGQANGTYIIYDSGKVIAVRGTLAATAAALTSASYVTPAQLAAAIAALVFPFAMGMAGTGTAATVIARYVSLSSTNETAFVLGARTLVNIVIEMSQNNITAPITFTLLKNGVDQAGPVVFAGGETGAKTIAGLALLSTDRVSVRYDYTGGTAGTTWAGGVTFNVSAN